MTSRISPPMLIPGVIKDQYSLSANRNLGQLLHQVPCRYLGARYTADVVVQYLYFIRNLNNTWVTYTNDASNIELA